VAYVFTVQGEIRDALLYLKWRVRGGLSSKAQQEAAMPF